MREGEEHQNKQKEKKTERNQTKEVTDWQREGWSERDRTVGDQVMTLLRGSSLCAVALGGG